MLQNGLVDLPIEADTLQPDTSNFQRSRTV